MYLIQSLMCFFLFYAYIAPPVIVAVGSIAIAVNVEDNVLFQFEIIRANPPVVRDNITWSLTTSSGQRRLECENTTKYISTQLFPLPQAISLRICILRAIPTINSVYNNIENIILYSHSIST